MLRFRTAYFGLASVSLALVALVGCGGGDGDTAGGGGGTSFVSMGTAPVGGAFNQVGADISEVLNNHKGENTWKVQAKGTKGSQENIRRLDKGELQLALSNAAISYHAVNGTAGWDKKYDIRTIATIAPNVAMFITKADSGIKQISDLKGKRVICGPAGAGFEMFIDPIIQAHGISFDDFTKLNDTQSGAVDKLADGNADAAFLGGAVPTGAIVQACSSMDIYFVPFDPQVRDQLIAEFPFFQGVTIPQDKYADLTEAYQGLNVGSMHLITSASQPEDLIYQITKTVWEHRGEIAHPAAKFINEDNAARFTGTDFHAGAEKFYREAGVWPEDGASSDKPSPGDLPPLPAPEEESAAKPETKDETPADPVKKTDETPAPETPAKADTPEPAKSDDKPAPADPAEEKKPADSTPEKKDAPAKPDAPADTKDAPADKPAVKEEPATDAKPADVEKPADAKKSADAGSDDPAPPAKPEGDTDAPAEAAASSK